MCYMEIPREARKCPFCQHFQNRLSMMVFHPAIAVLPAVIVMFMIPVFFAKIFDPGEDFESYKDQIRISESEAIIGSRSSNTTIAVIGTITNTSPVPWKQIVFHVEFFNAQGMRVDVGQKEQYSFYLPPKDATSFKVSFPLEFPESNYAKHSIRVLAAKDGRSRW